MDNTANSAILTGQGNALHWPVNIERLFRGSWIDIRCTKSAFHRLRAGEPETAGKCSSQRLCLEAAKTAGKWSLGGPEMVLM